MKTTLYDYQDYKKYLNDLIESFPSQGRGKRKELAQALSCQVSHVTNVLSHEAHFSKEQAYDCAKYFGLNFEETQFLLLLLEYNRAGHGALRAFYQRLIEEKKQEQDNLKKRLKMPDALTKEQESRYYSSWHYAAIHVLLSIPEFQDRESLAQRLILPQERVDEVLDYLMGMGLCEKENHRYKLTRHQLHLDKSSPHISKHHTNWRLKSILSLDQMGPQDLHYSSVFTIAKKDLPKVREALSRSLEEALKIISPSPEEELAAMTMDLFVL